MNIITDNIKSAALVMPQYSQGKSNVQSVSFGNNTVLPSVYPMGQSLINKDTPVSYTSIGEITIPGLKDKARIYKLANGQRIVIAPKKGPAIIKTTYNVGSMNEPDNIRGMSHFIEHNLFNGSKNLAPKEYDQKVSELGGDTNASTSFANTDYYLQLQLLNDNSLEEAIKLNAEQTQFPIFPNEQIIKEKEPVKSEIDMCSDNSDTVAVCKVLKNLFNVQSTSEDFVIGTKANINSFTRDMVLDYFNTWYTPDNAVTVITGDVDPDETINLVSKHFNKQNDYSNIHKRTYEPVKYNDKPVREDIIKSNTTQPSITMGFVIPDGTSEAELDKLAVLYEILQSPDSNLRKEMSLRGAEFEISTENMQNKPQGAKAALIMAFAPEEKLEDVIKLIYKEITKIANNPPLTENVNNIKKNMINRLLNISESSQALNRVLTDAALNYNYDSINYSINNLKNITPYDISDTAKKYFDLNKVSICVSHDRNATSETIISNYKKTGAKEISFGAKISPLDNLKEETAKVSHSTLPNNIESMVINGNPYAKSCIVMDFCTDELNKTSLSAINVLNKILTRGTGIRNEEEYNNLLNAKDINISCLADNSGLVVMSEFNSENLQDTIDLMYEKIRFPEMTEKEFQRAKQFVKDDIKSEKISAYDKLFRELHPELKKFDDKETRLKELEALTLDDLKNMYAKMIRTSQVQSVMSAPAEINTAMANIMHAKMLKDFPVMRKFTLERGANYNIYKPNEKEKVLTTEREQAQAEIVQGYKYKLSENADDMAKIELLNTILGSGGMSSRLFLDLREHEKLAYSVGSNIKKEKDTGVLYLRINTTTESTDPKEGSSQNVIKALEGFRRNVNLLKTQNVSEKELENAKTLFKTRILDCFETNKSRASVFGNANYSYYGMQFYEKLFEAVDKITPDDIRAAANYVFQNPPVISIAASKKTLEDLNLNK